MNLYRVFLFVSTIAVIAACSKATLVGSELLENEKADLQFVDGLELKFTTVVDDSVQTFPANLDRRQASLLCGSIEDPIFGKYSSEIYTQIGLSFASNAINMINAQIDSVILFLEYDTTHLYGNEEMPVSFEISRMIEDLDVLENYYASQSFEVDEVQVLGTLENHVPHPFDSILVTTPNDTSQQVPHLRIPLDPNFLIPLLADTVNVQNQDSLNSVFNGMRIKMTESNNTMLSFNLSGYSGVVVHFKQGDDETPSSYNFEFEFTTVSTVHQEHDYTGSSVEPFIADQAKGDSLFFIQSMIGLNTEIEIANPAALGDVLINHATLELFAIELDIDEPELYPPGGQLVTLDKSDPGAVRYSDDVVFALSEELLQQVFGGNVSEPFENDMRIRKYEMVITSQIQDIINGKLDKLTVASFYKSNEANRTVFIGPNHPDYPPRLKVALTKAP